MIITSEIGDKTFLIAAVMAMKHSRIVVFTGASVALVLMTILSSTAGQLFPKILNPFLTNVFSCVLFLVFGLKLAYEAYFLGDEYNLMKEIDDLDIELDRSHEQLSNHQFQQRKQKAIFFQTFVATFAAEWGDRSQISTVAMSSSKDFMGINLGAIFGHALCTGIAVSGGKLLAGKISVRAGKNYFILVTIFGSICFFLFSLFSAMEALKIVK